MRMSSGCLQINQWDDHDIFGELLALMSTFVTSLLQSTLLDAFFEKSGIHMPNVYALACRWLGKLSRPPAAMSCLSR